MRDERAERRIKRRVRKNGFAAFVFLLLSFALALLLAQCAYMYWEMKIEKPDGGGISQVALRLPSLLEEEMQEINFIKYLGAWFSILSCSFFACLAFRRGEEKRVKIFWLFLYLGCVIGVLVLYWFWNVMENCDGDLTTWLQYLSQGDVAAQYWIAVAVLAVIGLIMFLIAHHSALFAGKEDTVRRFENGKIHGGVCFTYICLCFLGYFIVPAFILFLILRKIVRSIKRASAEDDLPSDEPYSSYRTADDDYFSYPRGGNGGKGRRRR